MSLQVSFIIRPQNNGMKIGRKRDVNLAKTGRKLGENGMKTRRKRDENGTKMG